MKIIRLVFIALAITFPFSLSAPSFDRDGSAVVYADELWDGLVQCSFTTGTISLGSEERQIYFDCDFANRGSLEDKLIVISRKEAVGHPTDWLDLEKITDAIWIFDYKGDTVIELVIDFQKVDSALVAEMYDSQNNPTRLDYTFTSGYFDFTSDLQPTIRVVAPDGWWKRGALVNFNLNISVDGLVNAAFQMSTKLEKFLVTDGIVDFEISVRDLDGDGRPEYDWRTVRPPAEYSGVLERTFLMVNTRDNEAPLVPVSPWPYLGLETYGYLTSSPHQVSQPPIQFNWEMGRLTTIGEFVSSRGNDAQWFLYSFNEVIPGQVNETNFENPFAWYDLAEDGDRSPELAVRFVYYPPWDEIFNGGPFPKAIDIVRYSWDQDNDNHWDYKLGLVGTHTISSTVTMPDFALRMLPYDEIPAWITDQKWSALTFVAAEVDGVVGEGIYVWDHPAWFTDQYITGATDSPQPPADITPNLQDFGYSSIPDGFRGEYQNNLQALPLLYFSAVDHKLHLLRAEGGLWNIDSHAEMRYSNTRGEEFIDQWIYTEPSLYGRPAITRKLNVADTHLLYSGEGMVVVRQARVSPSIFVTLPPGNNLEWKTLGKKLVEHQSNFAPGDLRAMMRQFAGSESRIIGATERNYRVNSEASFRFILSLKPGFSVQGPDLLDVANLQPGEYLVVYDDEFKLNPLSAPVIRSSIIAEQLSVLEINGISIQLRNDGFEDLTEATLELWTTSPAGTTTLEATKLVDLWAQESSIETLEWAPTSPGNWLLTPRIRQLDGRVFSGSAVSVVVPASASGSPLNLFFLSTPAWRTPLILLTLIGLATLTSVVFWRQWGKPLVKRDSQTRIVLRPNVGVDFGARCPICQADAKQSKAGFNRSGSQKYRCSQCKRTYTPNPRPRGYPADIRILALKMYSEGYSYKTIAWIIDISPRSVMNWVRLYSIESTITGKSISAGNSPFEQFRDLIKQKQTKSDS